MLPTWGQTSQRRHPWFHTFATKRKVRTSDSTNELTDVPRPVKRRRCSTLERGFAHLSLTYTFTGGDEAASIAVGEAVESPEDPMDSSSPTFTGDANVNTVITPSYVEEPTPIVNDVKMRTSTWYEPEPDRIVITELESSSDEESEVNNDTQDSGGFYVSPTLLDHIRSHTASIFSSKRNPATASASQALVPFRPRQYSTTQTTDETIGVDRKEEDAMDLDP